jgi:hypothetical protein
MIVETYPGFKRSSYTTDDLQLYIMEPMMIDKKLTGFKSPDLTKMQEVIIDYRTKIYIAPGADAKKAKSDYLSRYHVMKKS